MLLFFVVVVIIMITVNYNNGNYDDHRYYDTVLNLCVDPIQRENVY